MFWERRRWIGGLGGREGDFSEIPRLRSNPSPVPLSPYLQPVSVCSDQVFVVIVSAPLGRWAVLAVLCVLAVPSPPTPFFV